EKVLAHPGSEALDYAEAALAIKLLKDRAAGIEIADRFLRSASVELHVAVSGAYNALGSAEFERADFELIRKLLASPHASVLARTLWVVRRIAEKDQPRALNLLKIVEFGDSHERADSVLSLFGRPIPLESLSAEIIQEYLDNLAALPHL